MAKKRILETVHETAKGLHKAGAMDTKTMREFDVLCLPPVKNLSATQIKRLRTRNQASQAVFAAYLNTSFHGTFALPQRAKVLPMSPE